MRLLNAHTMQLEEILDVEHAPAYAILSHTWGNDEEEVSYAEMLSVSPMGDCMLEDGDIDCRLSRRQQSTQSQAGRPSAYNGDFRWCHGADVQGSASCSVVMLHKSVLLLLACKTRQ